jgi:hypothetical protein
MGRYQTSDVVEALFARISGGSGNCGPLRFVHHAYETETFARQRFDQALFLAGIADRAPGVIQAGRQRRI